MTSVMQNSGVGFSAFYNDEVSGLVITGASVTIGVCTSIISMSVGVLFLGIIKFSTVGIISFLFGTLVALTSLSIVKSAVTTLFICLIAPETRNVFEQNHPEDYKKLSNKFKAGNDATREIFNWLPCICICF